MFKLLIKSCVISGLLSLSCASISADIVAHPSTQIEKLNKAELRAIFSLQITRWADGSPIVVLRLASNNPTHKAFCKYHLKILPQQLDAVWEQLVFTGQRARPLLMNNEKEMMSAIASTPGAIGYITGEYDHVVEIKTVPVNP